MGIAWKGRLLVGAVAAALIGGAIGVVAVSPAEGQRRSPPAQASAPSAEAAAGVVNINTASEDELERLPGIGPSKARAIVELRQRMGRFQRVEDILRVRGIGRATFRRLRPMLTIQGQTTLAAQAPRPQANR